MFLTLYPLNFQASAAFRNSASSSLVGSGTALAIARRTVASGLPMFSTSRKTRIASVLSPSELGTRTVCARACTVCARACTVSSESALLMLAPARDDRIRAALRFIRNTPAPEWSAQSCTDTAPPASSSQPEATRASTNAPGVPDQRIRRSNVLAVNRDRSPACCDSLVAFAVNHHNRCKCPNTCTYGTSSEAATMSTFQLSAKSVPDWTYRTRLIGDITAILGRQRHIQSSFQSSNR